MGNGRRCRMDSSATRHSPADQRPSSPVAAGFTPWIYRTMRTGLGSLAKSNRSKVPTADHFYARLLRVLAKRGYHRTPEQTPVEFLGRLRAKNVNSLPEIAEITQIFCDSRYGEQPLPPEEITRLTTLLSRIETAPENAR